MEQDSTNPNQRPSLNESSRVELRMLLLLDWMMAFDQLHAEKQDLEKTLIELQEQVDSLKKGFFKSVEEEDALHEAKNDLKEAERARDAVEREMEEVNSRRFHLSLASKDEDQLEPTLKQLEKQGWIEVGEDDYYITNDKGLEIYQKLTEQQESYVSHFDIYAYVDLQEGVFADPQSDLLEGDRWSDLRVAVAEHKGIDPYRVVFLSMLADGVWFENPDWRFDLGMGTLLDNLESLVMDQLSVDELGYEDDQGKVEGEEVIADVIEQGTDLARERNAKNQSSDAGWPGEQLITHSYFN